MKEIRVNKFTITSFESSKFTIINYIICHKNQEHKFPKAKSTKIQDWKKIRVYPE